MNTFFNLINPFSSRFHAVEDFKKLKAFSKITVLVLTTLTSLLTVCLATSLTFRVLVDRLKPLKKATPPKPHEPTANKAEKIRNQCLAIDKVKQKDLVDEVLNIPSTAPIQRSLNLPKDKGRQNDLEEFPFVIQNPASGLASDQVPVPPPAPPVYTPHVMKNGREITSDLQELLELEESFIQLFETLKEEAAPLTQRVEASENIEQTAKINADVEESSTLDWLPLDMESSVAYNLEMRTKFGLKESECNLLDYLSSLGENWEYLQTGPISFKEGKIVPLAKDTQEEKELVRNQFLHILKETYGTELSYVVIHRYKLNEQMPITAETFKKALIGVAANVKVSDVEKLFNDIKNNNDNTLAHPKAGELLKALDRAKVEEIKAKNDFSELSEENIEFLLSAFKQIRSADNSVQSIGSLIPSLYKESLDEYLITHDVGLLQMQSDWNKLRMDLNDEKISSIEGPLSQSDLYQAALTEYIGKTLTYAELKTGMVFKLLRQDGSFCFYKVAAKLDHTNDAVISYVFAPLNEYQDLNYNEEGHPTLHLTFRGTLPGTQDLSGGASLFRDIDYRGVGRTTFEKRSSEIVEMLKPFLRAQAHVVVSGHSLGACDTQRGFVLLLKEIVKAAEGSPFKNIASLNILPHNPPRANPTLNLELKECIYKMSKWQQPISISFMPIRYFDKNYEDGVQKCGDVLLGTDTDGTKVEGMSDVFANAPFFKRKMLDITMDQADDIATGILPRHTSRALNQNRYQNNFSIKFRDSSLEKDRQEIDEISARFYHWNEKDYNFVAGALFGVAWNAKWLLFRQPTRALRAIAESMVWVGFKAARLNQIENVGRYL